MDYEPTHVLCFVCVCVCVSVLPVWQAFNMPYEVKNYAMRERTQKELDELLRVENMRKIELADSKVR